MSAFPTNVAPGSDRVRLAALAVEAATGVSGVLAAVPGPRHTHRTRSGQTLITGAAVTAEADGRYLIELGLHARYVPLPQLGETVRATVIRSVTHAGLGALLGSIHVSFHDIGEDPAPGVDASIQQGTDR